ncbi:MAG: amidohydrolase family protein, partial [Chloroflexi bacterium]|nr:amidohydrolase family protein [Chloroflexota bacterium]
HERGDRYLKLISESERSGLYAFRTLRAAGVTLAAGSDAPVTAPDPLRSAAAAVQRRTAGGRGLTAEEAVDYGEALEWWTVGAAYAGFLSDQSGSLRPGRRADLVLLSSDSSGAPSCTAGGPSVRRVWRAGQEIAPALDSEAEHK